MRLVLDTNVVVSALLWNGVPGELLNCASREDVIFFSSLPLLTELTDVLSRPRFEHRIAASQLSIALLVHFYARLTTLVRPHSVPRIAPDPDDDVVIGTALAARADFIVTGDRTFLSLGQYEDLRVTSANDALASIVLG
jgi:hypothetical protein